MSAGSTSRRLDPGWVLSQPLPRLAHGGARAWLRAVLAATAGTVSVEGANRIESQDDPCLFALTHHGAYEALIAPCALLALRRGRAVRFLVDWMFLDLPWTGWLLRHGRPIPVYRKPARWRLRERHRRAELAREGSLDRALSALAAGESVGVYPEGRRNPEARHLLPLRKGLARLAVRSGAPVLPVGLDFPASDRLGRAPRIGRLVLRAGEPLEFTAEHREWSVARRRSDASAAAVERELTQPILEAVASELARLARKVHPTKEYAAMSRSNATVPESVSVPSLPHVESDPVQRETIRTVKVVDVATRAHALSVLDEVYREEKRWLPEVDGEILASTTDAVGVSWFVAYVGDRPAGAVRLGYDPSLELPSEAEVELDPRVDLGRLARCGRFVEVGRLAISPRQRARTAVVLSLMRAVIAEVVARGYTHLLTAVFEDDPHSPYKFHTRVLGFERIGTHRRGELCCQSRRILLILDIARAYLRMKSSKRKLLSRLVGGFEERVASLPSP